MAEVFSLSDIGRDDSNPYPAYRQAINDADRAIEHLQVLADSIAADVNYNHHYQK